MLFAEADISAIHAQLKFAAAPQPVGDGKKKKKKKKKNVKFISSATCHCNPYRQ